MWHLCHAIVHMLRTLFFAVRLPSVYKQRQPIPKSGIGWRDSCAAAVYIYIYIQPCAAVIYLRL